MAHRRTATGGKLCSLHLPARMERAAAKGLGVAGPSGAHTYRDFLRFPIFRRAKTTLLAALSLLINPKCRKTRFVLREIAKMGLEIKSCCSKTRVQLLKNLRTFFFLIRGGVDGFKLEALPLKV